MKITIALITSFGLLLSLYAFSPFQPFTLSEREPSPAERFLQWDCAIAKGRTKMIRDLRADARNAERYFVSMIENGPAKDILEANRKDLVEFAGYRSKQGSSLKITEISKGKKRARPHKKESTKTYVDRRIKDLRLGLAQYAMEGLLVLNTPSALEYVNGLAKERTVMGELAREVLEK